MTGLAAFAAAVAVIWALAIADEASLPTATAEQFVVYMISAALALAVVVWSVASGSILIVAGLAIGVAIALGLWISTEFGTRAGITFAVCMTAPTSFIAVLLAQEGPRTITKNSMRNSITASFVLTYLVVVGLVVFFREDPDTRLPEITETLISNFTFLLGVVIAFYFGSATFEKVAQVNSIAESPGTADQVQSAVED